MIPLTLIILALFVCLVASIVDIKIMEVPDWLSYGGIAAGLGLHLIMSAQQWNWWPIASSGIGLAIGFGLACIMFYTGQWGGGDAKLLMAMGAIIGFEAEKFSLGANFLINLVFIGAAWGLLWSAGLAIKNGNKFWKTFKAVRHHKPYARLRIMTLIMAAFLIAISFYMKEYGFGLLVLALITYALCYLSIFVKSVELSGMHKWISPAKLVEGDWLVHAVKVGKTVVKPTKLGLDKKQVKQLQKLHKEKSIDKVLVKYGVPFTPAFLFSFIVALWGNIVLLTL